MDTRPLFTELYLRNQKAKIQVIGFVQLNSIKDMKKQKHRHGAGGFCCISLLPNRTPIESVILIVRGLFA